MIGEIRWKGEEAIRGDSAVCDGGQLGRFSGGPGTHYGHRPLSWPGRMRVPGQRVPARPPPRVISGCGWLKSGAAAAGPRGLP